MSKRLIYLCLFAGMLLSFDSCKEKKKGCTDPRATNFDLYADEDDGTCVIPGDPILGTYIFNGNRSGTGGFVQVKDTFTISFVVDNKYKFEGFLNCPETIVRSQGSSFMLESSNCGLFSSNWNCFMSASTLSFNFSKIDTLNNYSYSGQAVKQ